MTRRIGPVNLPGSHMLKLWLAGIVAAAIAFGVKLGLIAAPRMWMAVTVLIVYGIAYLLLTAIMGVDESLRMVARITRRRRG